MLVSDYTVVDIETTDCNVNDCEMIEVAAVRIRDNVISDTFSSLMKPYEEIPSFIEFLTGITNEMVCNAPLPYQVLPALDAFIGNDIVVGHNIASFDSCVLYDYYQSILGKIFSNSMVDTMHFARKCTLSPVNYKLATLAGHFGITYDAHRALNDCIANYKVYEQLKPLLDESKLKNTSDYTKKVFSEKTLALAELSKMNRAIISAGSISDTQILEMQTWMKDNLYLSGNYPFDSIFEKIEEISKGGTISEEDRASLLSLLQIHSDPVRTQSENSEVNLTGRNVCLTGEFQFGARDTITKILINRGVFVMERVTSKTEYLIVGGNGSTAWACGNYGSKIKKALELQAKGKPIKIIREDVLMKWLNTMN